MKILTNLLFKGDCREAFELYADVLGGQIKAMVPFSAVPGEEKLGPHFQDKIMHAWLDVGEESIMGCDAPPEGDRSADGFTVAIHVSDANEARRIFNGLVEGGTVSMPFGASGWSPGFGMLTDRFGTPWVVNTTK